MAKELQAQKEKTALPSLGGFNREQIDLIKSTVAVDTTDNELKLFLYACKHTGLDPLVRQIYAIKRKDGDTKKMTIQTSIDGYRLIADRTGKYAGNDDAVFEYADERNPSRPTKATSTVYKVVGGQRIAFTASARWSEYCPGGTQAFMWNSKPHVMLSKCSEALALRKAFPAELSGLHIEDEMAIIEVEPIKQPQPLAAKEAAPATKEAPPATNGSEAHETAPKEAKKEESVEPLISAQQVKFLADTITRHKVDLNKFYPWLTTTYRVKSLEEVKFEWFSDVLTKVNEMVKEARLERSR